jgi:hypothetical protein
MNFFFLSKNNETDKAKWTLTSMTKVVFLLYVSWTKRLNQFYMYFYRKKNFWLIIQSENILYLFLRQIFSIRKNGKIFIFCCYIKTDYSYHPLDYYSFNNLECSFYWIDAKLVHKINEYHYWILINFKKFKLRPWQCNDIFLLEICNSYVIHSRKYCMILTL